MLVAAVGCWIFDLRMIYEQTILTRQKGPQILGFAMAHLHPELLVLGILSAVAAYAAAVVFVVRSAIKAAFRKLQLARAEWLAFAVLLAALAVPYIPYSAWQLGTLIIAGPGRSGVEQLAAAAGENQRYLVRALLDAGVPVNRASEIGGGTPLNRACAAHLQAMAEYLIARGARLDDAQECRKIPDFASRIKPIPPEPDDGLPKVPGLTVEVRSSEN